MADRSSGFPLPSARRNTETSPLQLVIEHVSIEAIRPNPRNARKHGANQMPHLVAVIGQLGFIAPVLITTDGALVAGHGRLAAAKILGLKTLPAIRLPAHFSETDLRVLALADNRIAELAQWDEQALQIELSDLVILDTDYSISDLTGFSAPVLDAIVHADAFAASDSGGDNLAAPPQDGTAIAQLGDIFSIGPHRLMCADCRDQAALTRLFGKERASQCIADGPYNVPIHGHVSGKGRVQHREFPTGVGEMSGAQFRDFNRAWVEATTPFCVDGALFYAFMGGIHLADLIQGGTDAGLQLMTLCVWAKSNAGMGSLYRSQIEHVVVFKSGKGKHTNNIQLGRHGRNRSNLWSYPGMNTFGAGRDAALKMHPTVKPVGLLADAILDASKRGDIVFDPFLGSGSTLIAAHRTGRRGYGVELDPLYVDAALDRLVAVLGVDSVRVHDGTRWSDLRAARDAKAGA